MDTIRRQLLSIRRLDSDSLKLIAVITMLIDHIAAALIQPTLGLMEGVAYDRWSDMYHIMRDIGRTAFPIFVFLLIEGFFHTCSRIKYFERLILFALLSEIPYDMAFYGVLFYKGRQNVFWTLSLGFCIIWGLENLCRIYRTGSGSKKTNEEGRSLIVFAIGLVLVGIVIASYLRADYGIYGLLLILLFYLGEHGSVPRVLTCVGGYLLFLWEPYCFSGFLLILFYNGMRVQRGRGFQYFFYLFYPVHLLILGLIRIFLGAGGG